MKVLIYESNRGEDILERFLTKLDAKTVAKVIHVIDLLERYGRQLGMPHSRHLSDNLYELRIRGKIEVRIFYALGENHILLLHAYQKKTEKLPSRELMLARKRLNEMKTNL